MIDNPFAKWKTQGEGMGLFERTHLPDQTFSDLWGGPIRGLYGDGPLESTAFCSGRSQGGPLAA